MHRVYKGKDLGCGYEEKEDIVDYHAGVHCFVMRL